MPERMAVHLGALAQAADDLDTLAGELREHLDEIDRGVHRVAENWDGEAKDAFRACYQQWSAASADLYKALRTLHHILRTAHGNYSAARTANLRMWGGR